MGRKRLDTPPEGREAFDHWLETEYNVVLEWSIVPAPNISGALASRVSLFAIPTPWADMSMGHWVVFTDIPWETPAHLNEKVYRLLQSKLALDLQVERMFGPEDCRYFVPVRAGM